ncbi:MAG: hypothetical protein JRF33_14560 [Deltaproteobacteria bacterium]|nr:hypothetical protein [Deltaproteobacteria bacterium]
MKKSSMCFVVAVLAAGLTGCKSRMKEDTHSFKLSRPVGKQQTQDIPMRTKETKDLIALNNEVNECLVGDWPEKAAPISIEEHKTPVRDVLRKFARISRLNFVVADEVKGEISGLVKAVPWTQALRAVLQAKNLVAVKEGNVVRVLSRDEWDREMQ